MLSYNQCMLCPRMCGVDRTAGECGLCGAVATVRAARAALHMWEEPPLVCGGCEGDAGGGPGVAGDAGGSVGGDEGVAGGAGGSGTVFFSHCGLGCVYCQNRELAQGAVGWELSVEELAAAFLRLQDAGACNINLVTGTHYAPTIVEAVAQARQGGLELPVVWNSSGYERPELVRALVESGTVDIFLFDYKYGPGELSGRYSSAPDYPEVALAAIDAALGSSDSTSHSGGSAGAPLGHFAYDTFNGQRRMTRGVIVRHMLLPGGLGESKAALRTLYERFGNRVNYSIMNQYTPVAAGDFADRFPELCNHVAPEDYEELLSFADDLGMDYFWQEEPACAESFIPAWNGEGILGYNS